jgi:iron complex transport system ATP-binding protein
MDQLIFTVSGASFRYPGSDAAALRDVNLTVREGELVAIVGPNGGGKTTLLRVMLGVLRPHAGTARVRDRASAEWDRRDLARLVGVVVQREEPAFPLSVHEAVRMGRYAHVGPLGAFRDADRAAVRQALSRCDVERLANRFANTLSGGEWQRVRIARALAQQPRALVLDEPTANLDVRHEMEVVELVAGLVRTERIAAVVVTHHVNLAARYADRIVVLDAGEVVAVGPPGEVLTRATLERVFRWPVEVSSWHGAPQFVPLRPGEQRPDHQQPSSADTGQSTVNDQEE